MNRADLTTPQRRILEAIEQAEKPIATAEIKVASSGYTIRVVRMLHEERLIHIAAWGRHPEHNNGFYARWRPGAGQDAPKPLTPTDELRRRKRARQQRWEAGRREDQAVADADLPPPALPTTTPRIGFWGM